jgi:fission process protein 1
MWPWSSSSDKPTGSPAPENERPKPAQTQSATDDLKKAAADMDPEKLPDRKKLPKKLQKIIDKSDKEENFFEELVEG